MKRFIFYKLTYSNYSVYYKYDQKKNNVVSIINEPCRIALDLQLCFQRGQNVTHEEAFRELSKDLLIEIDQNEFLEALNAHYNKTIEFFREEKAQIIDAINNEFNN